MVEKKVILPGDVGRLSAARAPRQASTRGRLSEAEQARVATLHRKVLQAIAERYRGRRPIGGGA